MSLIIKHVFQAEPVMFRLSSWMEETDWEPSFGGMMKVIRGLPDVPLSIQAQCYRVFGAREFPDDVCMLSDIDMFSLRSDHYNKYLSGTDQNDLVLLGSDCYDLTRQEVARNLGVNDIRQFVGTGDGVLCNATRFPICYLIGRGGVFKQLVDSWGDNWSTYIRNVYNHYNPSDQRNAARDTDEVHISDTIINYDHGLNVVCKPRGYSSNFYLTDRIEKNKWVSDAWINKLMCNFYASSEDHDCKSQDDFPVTGTFCLDTTSHIVYDNFMDIHVPDNGSIPYIARLILDYYGHEHVDIPPP
jgi:hypothetical protein